MKKTNNKGFSLVELIIVVAIMAILIGVLAPQYIKYVERSRVAADENIADSVMNAVQSALADEDYEASIAAGETVVINGTNITAGASIQPALNEYFATWSNKKFKSKKYKSGTYTVTVTAPTGTAVGYKAVGVWAGVTS